MTKPAQVELKSGRVYAPALRSRLLTPGVGMDIMRRSRVMSDWAYSVTASAGSPSRPARPTSWQGLTLVHFSTQDKRLVWDRGCIQGFFMGCLGGVRG